MSQSKQHDWEYPETGCKGCDEVGVSTAGLGIVRLVECPDNDIETVEQAVKEAKTYAEGVLRQ